MKNKEIKPSDLKNFNDLDEFAVFQFGFKGDYSEYYWYKVNGFWFPHRKPTIVEINEDKFK